MRSKKVVAKIPVYFENTEPPVMGYKYNPGIGSKIFNYKASLTPDVVTFFENNNFSCDCHNSPFKNPDLNHVVTGNLDIIRNDKLKLLIKKGPKYRLPKRVNWIKNREIIVNFLNSYIKDWIKKENKLCTSGNYDENLLSDWKAQVLEFVDNRIKKGKRCFIHATCKCYR